MQGKMYTWTWRNLHLPEDYICTCNFFVVGLFPNFLLLYSKVFSWRLLLNQFKKFVTSLVSLSGVLDSVNSDEISSVRTVFL